ncbi:hypothetical protein BS17DRAFT_171598 [Gyrodon lividus]|nr:hypothetical protein BS17DRAFT_171598 [Gyrodon lividus]
MTPRIPQFTPWISSSNRRARPYPYYTPEPSTRTVHRHSSVHPPSLQDNQFHFEPRPRIRRAPSNFSNVVYTPVETFQSAGRLWASQHPAPLNFSSSPPPQFTYPLNRIPDLPLPATSDLHNAAEDSPASSGYSGRFRLAPAPGDSSSSAFSTDVPLGDTCQHSLLASTLDLRTMVLSDVAHHHCGVAGSWDPSYPWLDSVDQFLQLDQSYSFPASSALRSSRISGEPHSTTTTTQSSSAVAFYLCLWTEHGVICNTMVEGSRSRMNRHLHARHGFSGPDTRSTRCFWKECQETMQQGSIARHVVTCHMHAKATCPLCSKKLSRPDVINKHQHTCPANKGVFSAER